MMLFFSSQGTSKNFVPLNPEESYLKLIPRRIIAFRCSKTRIYHQKVATEEQYEKGDFPSLFLFFKQGVAFL